MTTATDTEAISTRKEWSGIESYLAGLLQDPGSGVDRDAVAPSSVSVRSAQRIISLLQFLAQQPPSAVVPDGNGGMFIEWQHGSDSRWIEISESGVMEQVQIKAGKQVSRRTFEL